MAVLNQMSVLHMIKEFRRNQHALCNSERVTLCGADSMLLALQLSMAENNKQYNGEFTVTLSDVLLTWKYLLHEKLDLPIESMEVVDHYEDIKKTYDDFLKNSNMLDLIDVYKKCQILTSSCENNNMISPIQLRDFLSGNEYTVDDETHRYTSPKKHSQDHEKAQVVVKKIIFSYLNLLVNSKNDLALAHILNIPDRGLGREAFTNLKHAAREKQMSIFLVATSFIRTIELGGKGYAPSASDPLRAHVKGLSNFINFIDKLNEILGEIPNPSIAGGRILSVIKAQLTKGQNSGDPLYKAVEEVVQDLDLRIKTIFNSQQEGVSVSTTDTSPARPKSFAINHGTAYCGRATVKTLLLLLDEEAASAPTQNKAELLYNDGDTVHHNGTSILTLFRSPTQVDSTSVKPLRERICKAMQKGKIKMKQTLIRSQFACTYKEDCIPRKESVTSSVGRWTVETSSGNVRLGRCKDAGVSRESSGQGGNKISRRGRGDLDGDSLPCDTGNEPPQCKYTKTLALAKDSQNDSSGKLAQVSKGRRCTAKDKLIPGQTKLTQFFRL